MTGSSRSVSLLALIALGLQVSFAAAAAPKSSAVSILNRVAKAQGSIKTLHIKYIAKSPNGSQMTTEFIMQRPDKVWLKTEAPGNKNLIICNGKKAWRYFQKVNKYVELDAKPGTIQPEDFVSPVLFDQTTWKKLIKTAGKTASYVGTDSIQGQTMQVVKIAESGIPSKLWIGTKDSQIHRVVLDVTQIIKKYEVQNAKKAKQPLPKIQNGATMSVNVTYLKINQPIPSSQFIFTAPKGAKKIQPPTTAGIKSGKKLPKTPSRRK